MNLEHLIDLASAQRPPAPWRRITYASIVAELPIRHSEAIDMIAHVRSPHASAAEIRTILRNLASAFPHARFSSDRSIWQETPEQLWRWAVSSERTFHRARLTRPQARDAVVRLILGGPHERALAYRMAFAFDRVSRPFPGLNFQDVDGDPDEIVDGLFAMVARKRARLAEPELDEPALIDLLHHVRSVGDKDGVPFWREDESSDRLGEQLPNAHVLDMVYWTHRLADAQSIISQALARRHPDWDYSYIS